jgi:hypothetical protein
VPEGSTLSFFLDAGVATADHPLPAVIDVTSSFTNIGTNSTGRALYFGSGEVRNTASTAIEAPTIAVVSHDSSGKLVVGSTIDACPLDIPPGAMSFASYGILGGAGGVDAPTVTLQTVAIEENPGIALATSAVTLGSVQTNSATVSGTVKNNGSAPVFDVGVCAGVYDASGHVVGADFVVPTIPASGLAAGQSVSFTVKINALFGTPTTAKAVGVGFAEK